MNKDDFQKYINERYYDQINWYDENSLKNKNYYETFQGALIVFSAITPVLIAIQMDPIMSSYLKWLPIFTSVFVAILASILKTFKYQEKWLNYRTISETLKKEIHFYNANIDDYYGVEDKEALFIERVESIISRENTSWVNSYKEDKKVEA
ncbi:MAG: DUF4231 domain-containing protein [Spirochaetes bacterium]|nr:DUF4231 domain-containing protein [Spirochaetota bacterium]